MTREEAIEHGKEQLEIFGGEHREFIELAIKALEQEPKTGRWVKISPADIYECSTCGQNVMTQDIKAYKLCHGCGAKMEGEEL